ncbi:hypothetical protein Sango_1871500 [Sesamum angolense]|uniref:GRF-type domain-containing protein n=1 Tax=Sesamum angolense TaxID=2727404 RepID=A0AAE2BQE7_9LAMI|nr:hypothetical protein Sango_1871500 [Sesamum angolense]
MEYTSTGDSSVVRTCLCDYEVVVRTSWTNSNPGRRFRGCPGDNGSYCGVFQWVDPPMCRQAKEIIPGLLSRLNDQERQLNEYQQKDFKKEALEGKLITYRLMGIVASIVTFVLLILYIRATITRLAAVEWDPKQNIISTDDYVWEQISKAKKIGKAYVRPVEPHWSALLMLVGDCGSDDSGDNEQDFFDPSGTCPDDGWVHEIPPSV